MSKLFRKDKIRASTTVADLADAKTLRREIVKQARADGFTRKISFRVTPRSDSIDVDIKVSHNKYELTDSEIAKFDAKIKDIKEKRVK